MIIFSRRAPTLSKGFRVILEDGTPEDIVRCRWNGFKAAVDDVVAGNVAASDDEMVQEEAALKRQGDEILGFPMKRVKTNEISSDEEELSIPVKRKVSYDSMDDGGCTLAPTKIRRFSEDEDGESDEIENDSEVESSDLRSSSIRGGYSHDVNQNHLDSREKTYSDDDKHLLSQIPPTEKKKWPQKPCILCRKYGVRRDTRYYCKLCNAALCKEPCFREYHTM